jgi:hypothetical protein
MTLRISALLALIASFSAAYASTWIGRLYVEFLKGAPVPKLTEAVLWRGGLCYWLFIPAIIVMTYLSGELAKKEWMKQRLAEIIMIVGFITSAAFMIGSVLPLTRITVSLQ